MDALEWILNSDYYEEKFNNPKSGFYNVMPKYVAKMMEEYHKYRLGETDKNGNHISKCQDCEFIEPFKTECENCKDYCNFKNAIKK